MSTPHRFPLILCAVAIAAGLSCVGSQRPESQWENGCSDQLDNDGDGFVDCTDQDCLFEPQCVGDDDDATGDDDDATGDDDDATGDDDDATGDDDDATGDDDDATGDDDDATGDDDDATGDDDDATGDDDDATGDDDDATGGELCDEALTISCGDNLFGTTIGGTSRVPSWAVCGVSFPSEGPEAVYTFEAVLDETVTIDLVAANPEPDLDLFVVGACDLETASCLGSSTDISGVEQVVVEVVAGATYQFVVDGFVGGGRPGEDDFTLSVGCSTTPDLVSSAGIGFRLVLPGEFDMGCTAREAGTCAEDEFPTHSVGLSHAFYLGQTEVTQEQWTLLMENNPSYHGPSGPGGACGDDCPVERVTWWDALALANALSGAEDLPECYILSDCTGAPGDDLSCDSVAINSSSGASADCIGYRLPTEAEWEYAARAGTSLTFSGSDTLDEVAWYAGSGADGGVHPVGLKLPNAWGFYDMTGNVAEWCWDWYLADYYESSPASNPEGPSSPFLTRRVERGGHWSLFSEEADLRVSKRTPKDPGVGALNRGIRLARTAR